MESVKERRMRRSIDQYARTATMSDVVLDHVAMRLMGLLNGARLPTSEHGYIQEGSPTDKALELDERDKIHESAQWTKDVVQGLIHDLSQGKDGEPGLPEGITVSVGMKDWPKSTGVVRVTEKGKEKFTAVVVELVDELHGRTGYLLVETE